MIHLYWFVGSQPARAVKALLDMGQIPHHCTEVNLLKNQTRSPEYLARNPLGQIPFIITSEGLGVGESNAIMAYLCQKYPDRLSKPYNLYGKTLEEKAKINQMLSWYQSFYRPALMGLISLKVYGTVKKGLTFSSYELQKVTNKTYEGLKMLESILQKSQSGFVCGNIGLTIADILIYFETTNLIYYEMMGELKDYPKLFALYHKIEEIEEISAIQKEWKTTQPEFTALLKSVEPKESPKL